MSIDDETQAYYYELEPVSVAFHDSAWTYKGGEAEEQKASKNLQIELEAEYGLPVGITSIGTGAAAPGFLMIVPSAIVSGALYLFFKGKEIQPNIDAWRALFDKYLARYHNRKPYFDRGGSFVLAMVALAERLGHDPSNMRLVSYKRRSQLAPEDMTVGDDNEIDDRRRIEAASVHVYKVEADGAKYIIHVEGEDVTFVDL